MAGHFEAFGRFLPDWLVSIFSPNEKTNLAPYRLVHFIFIAVLFVRLLPIDWPGLRSRCLRPLIVCGQRSLDVFCVGLSLSFVGHFLLDMISDSLLAQTIVSASGIAVMTAVAYYRSSAKELDRRSKVPLPKTIQPKR
jgi:hypothetical protein